MKVQVSRLKAILLFALLLSGIAHGAQTTPAASAPVEAIPADAAQLRELVAGTRASG